VTDAPRVVLDTNVALSALLYRQGRLAQLRDAWQQQRFVPLISQETAAELLRVLGYPKFRLTADDQREMAADLLPFCTVVQMPGRHPITPTCRDPWDLQFLRLAVVGKAAYLVSGDRDLLAVRGRMTFRILTPNNFLEALARA
jgi:uncharacterized protein